MRKISNLLAASVLIGIGLGIPVLFYLAVGAVLQLVQFFLIASFTVGVGVLVYVGAMRVYKERLQSSRIIDGSYPLQRHKLDTGDQIIIDINKIAGAAFVVGPSIGYQEIAGIVSEETQRVIAQAVQQTRNMAAISPGDEAQTRTGGNIAQPKIPAAITKIFSPPKTTTAQPPEPGPAVVKPGPAQNMIARPSPQTTKLAIGENDKGKIVSVDLRADPYLRLHGATQNGKTSLALLFVAQALRHGYEVIIFDTKRGADWGVFSNHANLIDANDPAVLIDGLANEMQRYQERETELGKHSAANLFELSRITGTQYPRRIFVIEEMGNQELSIQNEGKATYKQYITHLRHLVTKSGATGIHGIFIDQVPVEWDSQVRYNCTPITFYLPGHGGRVVGYPAAHKLPKYHCHYEGQIIKTGHLDESQIRQTIQHVPRIKEGTPTGGEHPANTPIRNAPANTTPTSPWPAFAALYFTKNPDVSQRAFCRAMAAHANDGRVFTDFLGQLSSDLFHAHSPQGNKYQPPAEQ